MTIPSGLVWELELNNMKQALNQKPILLSTPNLCPNLRNQVRREAGVVLPTISTQKPNLVSTPGHSPDLRDQARTGTGVHTSTTGLLPGNVHCTTISTTVLLMPVSSAKPNALSPVTIFNPNIGMGPTGDRKTRAEGLFRLM